jgi:sensor c-di-GMP phosphodiesterase-like protein
MTSFDSIIDKIRALDEEGFGIYLDAFGTGYSSLVYLKELPVSAIKIDKHFCKDLPNDKYSKGIVSMIADLSKTISVPIIVEGIEKEDQNDFIVGLNLDIIQGYLISKAITYDEALVLIKAYNVDKTSKVITEKEKKALKK